MLEGVDTAFVQAGLPGGYRVASELDTGGYGITFKVDRAGQALAVKILDTHWHEAAIRTPLEISALRSVSHPNVVRIVDEGTLSTPIEPGRYRYIACEFVEGANLGDLFRGGYEFSVGEALSIGLQVAAGLEAIHEARLIHRDVKPKNVMFNHVTGAAVLLDVGIAKHLDVSPVTIGTPPGTFGWKSPEQIRQDALDKRSDIYTLGLLVYWLATGSHPFENRAAAHGGDLEAAMIAGQFDSVRHRQPGLTPQAAETIDQMLAVQPYDRPRRARDVVAALQ